MVALHRGVLLGSLAVVAAACASATPRSVGTATSLTHPIARTITSPSTGSTTTAATATTRATHHAPTTTRATSTTHPLARPASPVTIGGSSGGPLHGTLRGKVITIDPGHNGANSQHLAEINRLVDIGVGMKACNTVGTATDAGYPEHAFNWDVGTRVAAKLRALGAIVVLTRPNDTWWGPCITDRAAIANQAHSAAAVSIHADGGPASGRGFHVIEPSLLPGLTDDIFGASARLGTALRDAVAAGTPMPTSTYAGSHGIVVSGIYGGLDRADVPAVFIECANMRNATDASIIVNAAFRDQLAGAIATGIEHFVLAGG